MPFPVSVSITGGGTTPTVSWVVPGNFTPNAFRINIFDKSLTSNGQVDIIHSVAINANSLSYALPSVLSSGRSLLQGGNYSINLQLIDTRNDNLPFTNNNAEILRRSNSYFSFTPLDNDDPPNVHLPTVQDGVYNFQVEQVGPNSVTFIDPVVAIGYDYATGAGDPNFLSLLLPNVGDGSFELDYDTATGHQHVSNLAHGARFFFGEGGVRAFRVTGIEASAMLDPNNVTAFITGLTFASNGSFTGTMTPLTINVVPEPETYALMALGLLAVGWAARRRQGRLG